MIDFYNAELRRLANSSITLKNMDRFIDRDKSKISWSGRVKKIFLKREQIFFSKKFIRKSSYRPFAKLNLYFCRDLNECQHNTAKFFPQKESKNLVICVSGRGANSFSVLITDKVPDIVM